MMRGLIAVGLLLAGCATSARLSDYLKRWEQDTFYGHVVVRQLRSDTGACLWREVTLRREVGLWVDGRPQFVRVTDYQCDDVWDSWHFRSWLDEQRADRQDLADLLLFLQYSVLPIPEHPRQL